MPDPPFVVSVPYGIHAPTFALHVKDPVFICRQRVGLTAGGMNARKHCMREIKEKVGSAVLWLLAFPGESIRISPRALLHWGEESYLI